MPRRPFGAPAAIHPIAFCAHTVQRVLYAMFRSKQLRLYSCTAVVRVILNQCERVPCTVLYCDLCAILQRNPKSERSQTSSQSGTTHARLPPATAVQQYMYWRADARGGALSEVHPATHPPSDLSVLHSRTHVHASHSSQPSQLDARGTGRGRRWGVDAAL